MPFVAIEKGKEVIYDFAADRSECPANCRTRYNFIELPAGTIERLIGRKLKAGNMPVELTEEVLIKK